MNAEWKIPTLQNNEIGTETEKAAHAILVRSPGVQT